jgi:predicted transposase YdaD
MHHIASSRGGPDRLALVVGQRQAIVEQPYSPAFQSLANTHDAFFKQVSGDPKAAGIFLREHSPPEVAELLTAELPVPVKGSFVDEELAQHHTDLLFSVRLKDRREALVYMLLEHKSWADPATPLQLLRYVVRILAKWYGENKCLPLPVVVPLVAHQGPGGWKCSTQFIDLFGPVPEPLRPYLVSFRHALVDLAHIDDDALSADPRLRAYLKTLKYVQRQDLPQRLAGILAPILSILDVRTILHYINTGPVEVTGATVEAALRSYDSNRYEEIMGHFTQEYFAEGEAKGLAIGEARGAAKGVAIGEARALIRLLEKRFGTLPSEVRGQISTADVTSLEAWFDRALDSNDLQSIFGLS